MKSFFFIFHSNFHIMNHFTKNFIWFLKSKKIWAFWARVRNWIIFEKMLSLNFYLFISFNARYYELKMRKDSILQRFNTWLTIKILECQGKFFWWSFDRFKLMLISLDFLHTYRNLSQWIIKWEMNNIISVFC